MTVFECGVTKAPGCQRFSQMPHGSITIAHLESSETVDGARGFWKYEKVAACKPCADLMRRASAPRED